LREAERWAKEDCIDTKIRTAYLGYLERWHRLAQEYGMTPVSRCKLTIPEEQKDDKEARYFA
jgi:phage terminase small subunit